MDSPICTRTRTVFSDVSNLPLSSSVAATADANNKQYKPQVITSSGFRGADKGKIRELASRFGAICSGELVYGHTTHLVCKRFIDCFGTLKYQRALEWGVHIVNFDWLLASATAGRPVPEADYKDDGLDALQPSPAPAPRQQLLQQQPRQQHKEQDLEQYTCLHLPTAREADASAQAAEPTAATACSSQALSAECQGACSSTAAQLVSTPAGCSTLKAQQQVQQQAQQVQQLSHGLTAAAAASDATECNADGSQHQLFAFGGELPGNFLLLGSDSPGSAGCQSPGPPSYSLSQTHHQQQQQHSVPGRLQMEPHAAAGGVTASSPTQCPGFNFATCSGLQQDASPCLQSFLPLLPHAVGEQQQSGTSAGSLQQQQQQQQQLAGSELQPDGILEVQKPAAPVGTQLQSTDLADTAPAPAAAAVSFAGAEEPMCQQQQLLIPETQYDDDVLLAGFCQDTECAECANGAAAAAAAAGVDAAAEEVHSSLHLPYRVPHSLTHYVNKQRRRQQEALAAPQDAGSGDSRRSSSSSSSSRDGSGSRPARGDDGGYDRKLGQTAAGPDGTTEAPLNSGSSSRQATGNSPAAVVAAAVADAVHAADLVLDRADSRHSSSPSGSTPMAFVRLRRGDGHRPRAGRVLVSSPLNPAELSLLEDSDCDMGCSRGIDHEGSTECGHSDTGGWSGSGSEDDSYDVTEEEDAGEFPEQRHASSTPAAAAASAQHMAAGSSTNSTAASSKAGESLPGTTGSQQVQQLLGSQAPEALQDPPAWQQHSPSHSCSGSSLPGASCPDSATATGSGASSFHSCADPTAHSSAAAAADSRVRGSCVSGGTTCSSSQHELPVMRLHFSLGGCSLQNSPAGCGEDQQQAAHTSPAAASSSDYTAGRTPQSDSACRRQYQPQQHLDAAPHKAQCAASSSGPGCSTDSCSSSGRSTGSSGSSKLRLKNHGTQAAAHPHAGTLDTAAALLQKRQALCCGHGHEWQEQQQLPRGGRRTAVTPSSEGSQFVTRRKVTRPAALAPCAAAADAAVAGELLLHEQGLAGVGMGCGDGEQQHDAAGAGGSSGSDADELSDAGVQQRRHGVDARTAPGAAAEQLLSNLRRQQRQQQQGWVPIPAAEQQQQQQPCAADALLRDLRLQQQQQHGMSGSSLLAPERHNTLLGPDAGPDACETAGGHESTSAAVAASRGHRALETKPRQSVSSSSCLGPGASTTSFRVPLKLEGGALLLHSCSASSSSSNGGLEHALRRALAAAGTVQQADGGAQQQGGQHRAGPAGVEDACEPLTATSSTCRQSHAQVDAQQQQQQQQPQQQQQGVCQDQGPVQWLHTPEDPQQQQQQRRQSQVDLVGMSTVGVDAKGAAMSRHLGARLAQLSQAHQEEVVPLKLLQKAPRGSTAKAHHGLKSSSKLTYADQVQVPWAHATFSTKERSRCAIMTPSADTAGGPSSTAGGSGAVFIGEPVAFYKLPSGEWWVELLRFYTAKELRELAKTAGHGVRLPPDFQLSYELLRGVEHEHWPMKQVQGEFKLSKVRKVPTGSRSRAQSPFFWRYSVDTSTCQLLSDRPATDLLVQ